MKLFRRIGAAIGLLVVLAVFGLTGESLGSTIANNLTQEKADRAIEKKLIETSQSINKQLPMMSDSETRLDMTMVAGKQLGYKFTMINFSEKEIDKQYFAKEMEKMLLKNVCGDEDMTKTMEIGVEYVYHYFDRWKI